MAWISYFMRGRTTVKDVDGDGRGNVKKDKLFFNVNEISSGII